MTEEQNLVEIHKELNELKQSSNKIVRMLRNSELKTEPLLMAKVADLLSHTVEEVEAKITQLDGKVFTLTSLGTRLRESRLKRGMTQKQLADDVGVTPVSIQKIEEGVTKTPRNLQAIADALSVGLDWLAVGDEIEPTDVSALRADGKLGERLRQKRVIAGYTLRDLAEKLDCTDMSISKIENGVTGRPRNLISIAKLLDVSPAWLLGGVEPNTSFEDWERSFKQL
ncbi:MULTISPECIES: helix-turn-helix domain-containing protein [Pseudoalteromonas]|uniref:helix-turn-helix domain-containing protein n=1 Tax=Pseudoalteromonas TaxID=53246 RepID=UPI00158147EF|nr:MULTISPECIES: helix-turn-helix transcriptional regulator [Pseudoalteromonas]MDI4654252.1 transcriptional regulator [Pseudoalteromonas shioyasakiensis]NUJ40206.1 transcriptional regulator [Pseudoalteromonas sp. 0303]